MEGDDPRAAEPEILRADPHQRRRFYTVMSLATAAAVVVIGAVSVWLYVWTGTVGTDQMIGRLRVIQSLLLAGCGVCLLLLAGHLLAAARQVAEACRWPLPGSWNLRDREVRRGDAALRVARFMRAAAVALVLLAVVSGIASVRLFLLVY